MRLSSLPDKARLPSAETATLLTVFQLPLKPRTALPVSKSHKRMVPSQLPLTARQEPRPPEPSAVTDTLMTEAEWPVSRRTSLPVSKSQRRSVESSLAEIARRPSGRKATLRTQP